MALIDLNFKLPDKLFGWLTRKKKVILVVEDDPATSMLICIAAEAAGFEVSTAEDCQMGLGILKNNGKKFALVMVDVRLSGNPAITFDGWALRREIVDHFPGLLVCMMSATKVYLNGFQNGEPTMVLEKPASYHKVFRELKRLI